MYHSNHLLGNGLPKYPVCLSVLSQESLYSFANDESRRAQAIKKILPILFEHYLGNYSNARKYLRLQCLKGKIDRNIRIPVHYVLVEDVFLLDIYTYNIKVKQRWQQIQILALLYQYSYNRYGYQFSD